MDMSLNNSCLQAGCSNSRNIERNTVRIALICSIDNLKSSPELAFFFGSLIAIFTLLYIIYVRQQNRAWLKIAWWYILFVSRDYVFTKPSFWSHAFVALWCTIHLSYTMQPKYHNMRTGSQSLNSINGSLCDTSFLRRNLEDHSVVLRHLTFSDETWHGSDGVDLFLDGVLFATVPCLE